MDIPSLERAESAARKALASSPKWLAEMKSLDVLRLAAIGPIDMGGWSYDELSAVTLWANGHVNVMPIVLQTYLERARAT